MLSHVKYRNSILKRIEKNLTLYRHPNLKSKIALNIICQRKYTMLFSTLCCRIHTNSICSHVKYTTSNFTRIEKIKILSRHPNVKNKIALNIISQKKYIIHYCTLFWSIYSNSVCSLTWNTEIQILHESKKI